MKRNKRYQGELTKEFLIKEYIILKKTTRQIASEIGSGDEFIRTNLIKYKIKRRSRGSIILDEESYFAKKVKIFWLNTRVGNKDDCWEWVGKCGKKGNEYGRFCFRGMGNIRAHKFSYMFHFGKIPDDMHVLHKCDNKKCVNPAHLFIGTHTDNLHDAAKKGIMKFGEENTGSILTWKEVKEIRRLGEIGELTQFKIAEMFNTSFGNVSAIILRKSWSKPDEFYEKQWRELHGNG